MKEFKVGERVSIILEVVKTKGYSCKVCFFDDYVNSCEEWRKYYPCSVKERSDKKNVIFKEVKE